MKSISNIYLSWRKGKGGRRHIVGILKNNSTEGIRFEYLKENLPKAFADGFAPYVDFPDVGKIYTLNVVEIFAQRLMQTERADIQKYYDFWELDKEFLDDKYYMLAYTQGMLSTDNFEFLADFYPKFDLRFVSEISGLSSKKLQAGTVDPEDELRWVKEPNNQFDKDAVMVFKGDTKIGYVKRIHNRVFHKNLKGKLKIVVKSVDQNGTINRIFVRIAF